MILNHNDAELARIPAGLTDFRHCIAAELVNIKTDTFQLMSTLPADGVSNNALLLPKLRRF